MPTKTLYFTDRNYERLKGENNMSKLVNTLLDNHYAELNFENKSYEELQKELRIIEIREEAEKKIEELKNGKSQME